MTRRLRAAAAIFRAGLAHRAAYLGEEFAGGLFLVAILLVFHQLYARVLPPGHALAGFSGAAVLWYVALTEAILTSAPRLSGLVDHEIRSGHVSTFLLRPISYVRYHRWRFLGEAAVTFPLRLALVSGVAFALVGPPPQGPAAFMAALLPVAGGMLLQFQIRMSLCLGAFWIEDAKPLHWVYQKTLFLLGGLLIPLDFYPAWVRGWAEATPLPLILYEPARLVLAPDATRWLACLGRQAAWFLVLAAVTEGLYRIGQRRLVIVGG